MYKPIIGLEVHIELNTKSKMFCSCPNDSDERQPNVNICPICLGHPGTLPVINEEAVRKVIKTGLALNCKILQHSEFDRKNYFYPDLPKGYQISQQYFPLCNQGFLKILDKKIRIRRVHLEEDTGRLIHPEGADYSLVDFNRAGVPLMELVTEPDIISAKQARKFAEELQLILRYLGVSGADMEKGQMRAEVNISLGKEKGVLGTKVEIKNLNSFWTVERAIDYEIKRQAEVLDNGGKVIQETRGWHDVKEITFSQREKEESKDYRYFSEPDLPPLYHSKKFIQSIKAEIPELPQQRRKRFKKEYYLSDKEIEIFTFYKDLGEYFEKVISELTEWVSSIDYKTKISELERQKLNKLTSNYIISDLQGLLKKTPNFFKKSGELITPENFAEFICLIYKGEISSKIAKIVLGEMFKTGADPSHIIKEKDLIQITDELEIKKIIQKVISKNPKVVIDYKKGKENAFQYLIGQAMIQSNGKASPQIIKDILKKKLIEN